MRKLAIGLAFTSCAWPALAAPLPKQNGQNGPSGQNEKPKEPTLEALVTPQVMPLIDHDFTVGMVVGVIQNGTTWVRGYGTVSPDTPKVPDGSTVYEIGSVSKVFTGLLLADAVERGTCTLDDRLAEHLPKSVSVPVRRKDEIFLWHLATHTAGLPRDPAGIESFGANPFAAFTPKRLYEALGSAKLKRKPGRGYAYSNLGAGLLGHALARSSQSTYDELLVARICDPLELVDTRVHSTADMERRLAPPYTVDGLPASNWDFAALAGCGAIRSTVNDLLRFAQANLNAHEGAEERESSDAPPLAQAMLRAAELRHPFGKNGSGIGLGWHIAPGGENIWHNGQTGGYHAFLAFIPKRGLALAVLANTTTTNIDTVSNSLLRVLLGQTVEPLKLQAAQPVEREVLERYVGTYLLTPTVQIIVTIEPEGFFAELTGQNPLGLYALDDERFFYRAVDARITFQVDEDGKATALVLDQNGNQQRAEKIR